MSLEGVAVARLWLIEALRRLCHTVSAAAIVVMLVISVADVISRKLFNFPISGVVDIVALCLVISTMLGIALCWSLHAHIVVDLLDMTGSPRIIAALDILTRTVGIVTMPLVGWLAIVELRNVIDFGDKTPDAGIPLSWFWGFILLGYILSALLLLVDRSQPARSTHV